MGYRTFAVGILISSLATSLFAAGCSSDEEPGSEGSGGNENTGGKGSGGRGSGGKIGSGGQGSGGKATGGSSSGGGGSTDECDVCADELTAEESLTCFCDAHTGCGDSLEKALKSDHWNGARAGCGYIELSYSTGYIGDARVYDAKTGKLVGASTFSDEVTAECIGPIDNGHGSAVGGELLFQLCPSAIACNWRPVVVGTPRDGGASDGGGTDGGEGPVPDASTPIDDGGLVPGRQLRCDEVVNDKPAKDAG